MKAATQTAAAMVWKGFYHGLLPALLIALVIAAWAALCMFGSWFLFGEELGTWIGFAISFAPALVFFLYVCGQWIQDEEDWKARHGRPS